MLKRYVYMFSENKQKSLGARGTFFHEMTKLGIPIPVGFTIILDAYNDFEGEVSKELRIQVFKLIERMEKVTKKKYGKSRNPLLLSVKSNPSQPMLGIMDTLLNVGLNDKSLLGIINQTSDERRAYYRYLNFIRDYSLFFKIFKSDSLIEDPFETCIRKFKDEKAITSDNEFTYNDLIFLVTEFKRIATENLGIDFPQEPYGQLWLAIESVFKSWNNKSAIAYRKHKKMENRGIGVCIQETIDEPKTERISGFTFTRHPSTGKNQLYGEYSIHNYQNKLSSVLNCTDLRETYNYRIHRLKSSMPGLYSRLSDIKEKLERYYKDILEFDFIFQDDSLWLLDIHKAARLNEATIHIAVEMAKKKIIDEKEALLRIAPNTLDAYLQPVFDQKMKQRVINKGNLIAKGINAGPGAATGHAVFNSDDAIELANQGQPVILVRNETFPEDMKALRLVNGILTARGGKTSHPALVARQIGKVCIVGCSELSIDVDKDAAILGKRKIKKEDWISLDGTTGEIFYGRIDLKPSEVIQMLLEESTRLKDSCKCKDFNMLMKWANRYKKIDIRANADDDYQAFQAVSLGAKGVGLCRTEHMFFKEGKIAKIQEMMLAPDIQHRKRILDELLEIQKNDFIKIFMRMNGLPVVIRTIDPPLHEFLPKTESEIDIIANKLRVDKIEIEKIIEEMKEINPMLGHRGCRLGITNPEIVRMQAEAVFQAAVSCKKNGADVYLEILIPMVSDISEYLNQKELVSKIADEIAKNSSINIRYSIGAMMETPRSVFIAGEIAKCADFISFGTNDLTQMMWGISRDDAFTFLPMYLSMNLLSYSPFNSIDKKGVGKAMEMAVNECRSINPNLVIGICGEQAGDKETIRLCNEIGFDYVSVSPFRIPSTILSAAQVAIDKEENDTLSYNRSGKGDSHSAGA